MEGRRVTKKFKHHFLENVQRFIVRGDDTSIRTAGINIKAKRPKQRITVFTYTWNAIGGRLAGFQSISPSRLVAPVLSAVLPRVPILGSAKCHIIFQAGEERGFVWEDSCRASSAYL